MPHVEHIVSIFKKKYKLVKVHLVNIHEQRHNMVDIISIWTVSLSIVIDVIH